MHSRAKIARTRSSTRKEYRSVDSASSSPTDWITAVGSITTPLMLLVLTGMGWLIKSSIDHVEAQRERAYKIEEQLREDRLKVYSDILKPFILVFTNNEAFQDNKAYEGKTQTQIVKESIISVEYRQAAFQLSLFASDSVIKAYNDLMQLIYHKDEQDLTRSMNMLRLLGKFLLEIRKNVGNEGTTLDNFAMLEWMISDMKDMRDLHLAHSQTPQH